MKSITIHNKATVNAHGTHTHSTHKPVVCITDRKFFVSMTDASEFYSVGISSISKVCQHKYDYIKTASGNKKFCYLSEVIEHFDELFTGSTEEIEILKKEKEALQKRNAELEADAAVGRVIREKEEAARKAEEERLKEIENLQSMVESNKEKITNCDRIIERKDKELQDVVAHKMELETETNELEMKLQQLKGDVK